MFKILSIPLNCNTTAEQVEKVYALFSPAYHTSKVTDYDAILCQINILRHKTENEKTLDRSMNISESFKNLIPLANSLCRLDFTAPVTTASNGRSFSKLKIIKSLILK